MRMQLTDLVVLVMDVREIIVQGGIEADSGRLGLETQNSVDIALLGLRLKLSPFAPGGWVLAVLLASVLQSRSRDQPGEGCKMEKAHVSCAIKSGKG